MAFSNRFSDRFAVSTWSLHRALGGTYPYRPGGSDEPAREATYGEGSLELVDVPGELAKHGIHRLEICSFHLPSRSASYIDELRGACEAAGVGVQTLLVEDGDLSHPETAERDAAWIAGWIDVAARLGANNMRAIAGKAQPTDESLTRAGKHLIWLADRISASGIRLVVENWFALLPGPAEVNRVLDALDGRLGLNGDFGNWKGPGKYDALAGIMGRAELCHAKAHYSATGLDRDDYVRCVELSDAAGYKGPFTLIYDSTFHADEWRGISEEREVVIDVLNNAAAAA
jgi:sugar phosphate isomerase/epimerase